MRALAVLLALAGPAGAQVLLPPGTDCEAPDGYEVVETCARAALEAADGELNLAYGLAMTEARVLTDTYALNGEPLGTPAEDLLRQAQRDWIAFRDAACAAEATLGGSEWEGIVALECLTRLTLRRTEDLSRFVPEAPSEG